MPQRVGLTHTQMKLGWGYQRLNELEREVEKFRNDAYLLTRQDDVKNSRHLFCVEQKITPDPIGMLIGEFAYNLRSGLDHLAWQLALLTTNSPNDRTAFPILGRAPNPKSRYWDSIRDFPGDVKFPATVKGTVNSLQPYKRGASFKDDPLWQLNRLCNMDKHQFVSIACIEFQIGIFNISKVWRSDLDHTTVVSIPLAEKDQAEFYVNVPEIVFGEPIKATDAISSFEIGMDGLRKIYNFVRYDAVPKFEPFFPKHTFPPSGFRW